MNIINTDYNPAPENYLREMIFVLCAQRKVIIVVATTIITIALLVALFWPPIYTSTAQIMVSRKQIEHNVESLEPVDYRNEDVSKEDVNSEVQLLTSNDLIANLALKLRSENKLFQDEEEDYQEDKNEWLSKTVSKIKKSISVTEIPYSKVREIALSWDDSAVAQLILSRLLDEYLNYRNSITEPGKQSEAFIALADNFSKRIEKGNNQLAIIMDKDKAASPAEEIKNNLNIKSLLEKSLDDYELELISVQQELALLSTKLDEKNIQSFTLLDKLGDYPAFSELLKNFHNISLEKAKMESVYTAQAQEISDINIQQQALFKSLYNEAKALKNKLQNKTFVLNEQIASLKSKIANIEQRNTELKLAEFKLEAIQKENQLLQYSYDTFFKRKEEAALAANSVINRSTVLIVARPELPLQPSFPNNQLLIPFSLFVAILSGIISGFLVEYFNHTFKRAKDIQNILNMACLYSIKEAEHEQS